MALIFFYFVLLSRLTLFFTGGHGNQLCFLLWSSRNSEFFALLDPVSLSFGTYSCP